MNRDPLPVYLEILRRRAREFGVQRKEEETVDRARDRSAEAAVAVEDLLRMKRALEDEQ